jgi:hypothetical protein
MTTKIYVKTSNFYDDYKQKFVSMTTVNQQPQTNFFPIQPQTSNLFLYQPETIDIPSIPNFNPVGHYMRVITCCNGMKME